MQLVWCDLSETRVALDARRIVAIRRGEELDAEQVTCELGELLGVELSAPRSSHFGAVYVDASSGESEQSARLIWLGLGARSELIACEVDNILVFDSRLIGDLSGHLWPACLAPQASPDGELTWLVRVDELTRSAARRHQGASETRPR